MGSAAVAALLLAKFEHQAKSDLSSIAQELAAHNVAQIARLAHALKGAAGAVAVAGVRDAAAAIESHARQSDLEGVSHEIAALQQEIDRCLQHIPAAKAAIAAVCANPPSLSKNAGVEP
ncbi:MAG: Hpt domain-containing protein [Phycisphaeraceae bacterium]|nr:Hpt domain-containing protein [Phycisphaeraceae bacterium]